MALMMKAFRSDYTQECLDKADSVYSSVRRLDESLGSLLLAECHITKEVEIFARQIACSLQMNRW